MFNHNKEWLSLPCSTRQLNFYSSSSIAILQYCTHKWIYGVYKFYTSIIFLTKTTTGNFLGHASNFVKTLIHQFPSIFNICLWCCTHKDTGWLHFTWFTQCSTKNMWRLISMMNKQIKKCLTSVVVFCTFEDTTLGGGHTSWSLSSLASGTVCRTNCMCITSFNIMDKHDCPFKRTDGGRKNYMGLSFIQCNSSNGMQTAMGSSISMAVFNCRDQGSTTTKDHKISTANVKTKDLQQI